MNRIQILAILLFYVSFVFSQENYELSFIKGEYEIILQQSSDLASPDDYFWNSFVLNRKGENLQAIAVLKDGLIAFPGDETLEKQLIEFMYKAGQYAEIKPLLTDYLDNPEMFLRYIIILGFDGEYQLAVDDLNEKIKSDSLNTEFLSLLADYYYQLDSLDASIKVLKKLIAINPLDMKNLSKLANFYVKNKDFEKSMQVCDKVLETDTLNKKFNRIKGIAGFNGAEFDIAALCFNRLIMQGDSGILVLKLLGISEFKTNKFDNSRANLLLAYEADSNDVEVNYYLGKAFLNSPNPEKGLFYFNRVDSLLQPDPKILSSLYYDKQSIYSVLGKYTESVNCYELAYQYHPKPEYIFYIAALYQHKLDNKKKAVESYEFFLTLLGPPSQSDSINTSENQTTVSLGQIARRNITTLKEELFFSGDPNK